MAVSPWNDPTAERQQEDASQEPPLPALEGRAAPTRLGKRVFRNHPGECAPLAD
jgi:hypothetical protein